MDREDVTAFLARHAWLLILGATATLFAVNNTYTILSASTFAGRDLVANYAFTGLMQENLLHGTIPDWSFHWLLGFPSFVLYPPLFFVVTAAANLLTGSLLGLTTWFKLVTFLSVFLLPLATYLGLKRVISARKAFFAGMYTLYFLFVYPPISHSYQVLGTGLVAQGGATLLLVLSLPYIFGSGRRTSVTAGLLLAATTLTHPFTGVVGFLIAGSHAAVVRRRSTLLPPLIGGLLTLPWLLTALPLLPWAETYTFNPAIPGTFFFLLLPLILYGGIDGRVGRALLATFLVLTILGYVKLPFAFQQFRFATYALGIGSILAGIGAYRVSRMLGTEYGYQYVFVALLLLPVLFLSVHAPPVPTTHYTDVSPVMQAVNGTEPGRVIVETRNQSIHDAYVYQAYLPLRTDHAAVNELHLDASPSANYILTLEDWVSTEMLYNPICRTCTGRTPPPPLVEQRLTELGVRYVLTRTPEATRFLDRFLSPVTSVAGVSLFEHARGAAMIEPLTEQPVALVGEHEQWLQANDALFPSTVSRPFLWLRERPDDASRYAAVIDLSTAQDVVDAVRTAPHTALPRRTLRYGMQEDTLMVHMNGTAPFRVKASFYPTHTATGTVYPANWNTMIVYPGTRTTTVTFWP